MTTKEKMEEARQAWHVEREALNEMKKELHALYERFTLQLARHGHTHKLYKDAKALWRVGREFGAFDPKQAEVLMKLRDGGVGTTSQPGSA